MDSSWWCVILFALLFISAIWMCHRAEQIGYKSGYAEGQRAPRPGDGSARAGQEIDRLAKWLMAHEADEIGRGGSESAIDVALRLLSRME